MNKVLKLLFISQPHPHLNEQAHNGTIHTHGELALRVNNKAMRNKFHEEETSYETCTDNM